MTDLGLSSSFLRNPNIKTESAPTSECPSLSVRIFYRFTLSLFPSYGIVTGRYQL